MRLASRMEGLASEGALEVAVRARSLEASGREVIHLEIGEPDFETPIGVREAAKRALDRGATHYAPYPGIPELRDAIAEDARRRKGLTVEPDQVFVTVGGKGVLFYAILALVDPGDEVIVPDPGYPMYASVTRFAGGTPVPLRLEDDFRVDPDRLAALVTPRTRLIVINSPGNPTGAVLERSDLERIAEIAIERDVIVLADEIYGRIVYEGEHVSIASLPGMEDRTIVLDGFSKAHAMTGWRLGSAIVPEGLRTGFGHLLMNSISCAPTFVQVGAVEALTGPQDAVEAMVAEFRARRDLVVAGLNAIPGIRCHRPQGAFYVFPDISGTGFTGTTLADRLLYEAGVSTLPGTAFGDVGTHHLRLSYANSRDEPVSMLDVSVRAQILNLLADLRDEFALTLLFISHDLSVIHHLTDWVAVMYFGRLVEYGPTRDVLRAAGHPYTRGLAASIPQAVVHRRHTEPALRGEQPSAIKPITGCVFRSRCPMAQAICAEPPPRVELAPNHWAVCHFAPEVARGEPSLAHPTGGPAATAAGGQVAG